MSGDNELVRRLIGGDEAALESLYDSYGSLLYGAALRIVGDPGVAEEVMQDSFFQLWRNATRFDASRGALIGWLLTITRHRAISRLRQKRSDWASYPLDEEQEGPSDGAPCPLEQHIARELVSAALKDLPAEQREVVALAYFEGMTCEEIARRTAAPLGTVKGRLRTATRRLQKTLSPRKQPQPVKIAPGPARLEDILITGELQHRLPRRRDPGCEREALETLRAAVAVSPQHVINAFLQMPVKLCGAGSAGLSLLETDAQGQKIFRWTHLVGKFARYMGRTTPRNFSPCGVTLDCNAAQLFEDPGRYFHYFSDVCAPIVEGLVIPFRVGEQTQGTVWIVSHREELRFDAEDVRIMTTLTEFAACALHVERTLGK